MASTDAEMYDSDSSDTLSNALGTEILGARYMVSDGSRETPNAEPSMSPLKVHDAAYICLFQDPFPPYDQSRNRIWPVRQVGLAGGPGAKSKSHGWLLLMS